MEGFLVLSYDDRSLETLYVRGKRVVFWGEAELPPKTSIRGIITRPKIFATTLRHLLSRANIKLPKDVVVAVPEAKVFIRIVEIPPVPLEKIEETVRWQAETLLSAPIDTLYFDAQFIAATPQKKYKILLTSCPREVINPLVEAINEAHLKLVGIDSHSGSMARLLAVRPHQPILIVNLESPAQANLVVAKNQVARLSTTFALTEDLMDLKAEIEDTIRFYLTRKEPTKKFETVYLIGAERPDEIREAVKTPGGPDVLAVTFSHFVGTKDPRLNRFTSLLGLTNFKPFEGVNLLPPEIKQKFLADSESKMINRLIFSWAGVLGISLLILTLGWLGMSFSLKNQRQQLVSLKSQPIAELEKIEKNIDYLNQKLKRMEPLLSKFLPSSINRSQTALSLLPPGMEITRLAFDENKKTLLLQGKTSERNQIIGLRESLLSTGIFQSVSLPLKNFESKTDISFELEAKIGTLAPQ